jgi:hypothetical protein
MFRCERCGTGIHSRRAVTVGNCPRCLRRDGVLSPLIFKLFEPDAEIAESRSSPAATPLESAGELTPNGEL